jgi:hypothetical protein
MTKAAQALLRSFKALPPSDQHEVLLQLLREPIEVRYEAPADADLVASADLVFLEYDKAEKAS